MHTILVSLILMQFNFTQFSCLYVGQRICVEGISETKHCLPYCFVWTDDMCSYSILVILWRYMLPKSNRCRIDSSYYRRPAWLRKSKKKSEYLRILFVNYWYLNKKMHKLRKENIKTCFLVHVYQRTIYVIVLLSQWQLKIMFTPWKLI